MREQLRDSGRLQNIVIAIDNIYEFVEGVTFDEYCNNKMMQFAVVKNFENIGEASYMLSKEFKENHTEIVWKDIIAMRHLLVHGYDHISDDEVWTMITNDLPKLKEQMKQIMDTL
jgi:uncharacterized protein with HEPN domain